MKKLLCVFAVVFVALFLFSFRTITAQEAAGGSKQTNKTLVMQASWKPGVSQLPSGPNWTLIQFGDVEVQAGPDEVVSPASTACLFCHDFTFENLAKRTVNYRDRWGDQVNPHMYVDEVRANPHHARLIVPDCLKCHAEHALPAPTAAITRARLNYCYSCHHEESFEACSDCH
jgi:predicted CXXCH cytochrome family protein